MLQRMLSQKLVYEDSKVVKIGYGELLVMVVWWGNLLIPYEMKSILYMMIKLPHLGSLLN